MPALQWLLLLYSLPASKAAARLALWRQLKRLGAIGLKTSAYVLPCTEEHEESFQWLAQKLRTDGGHATVVKVAEISGMPDEALIDLFQQARATDYEALFAELASLKRGEEPAPEWISRFQAIRRIDFFACPAAAKVQAKLEKLSRKPQPATRGKLRTAAYQGRIWQTRPRPVIDRIASAWLICRFIDRSAHFVFSADPAAFPDTLRFDMAEAHFGHEGDACTFETLCRRFDLDRQPALRALAEIVHDADLHDGRFGRTEGDGLLATFRGWAALNWSDDQMLKRGFECFDGLFRSLSAVSSASASSKRNSPHHGKLPRKH